MTLRYSCVETIPADCDSVNCLAFSPDGLYVAAGYDKGPVAVIDVLERRIKLAINWVWPVTALIWHPARAYVLVVGYGDGRVIAHELDGGNLDAPVTGMDIYRDPEGPVEDLDYCRDTNMLAWIVGSRVALCEWPETDEVQVKYLQHPTSGDEDVSETTPRSLHFSKGFLIVSYLDHGIACWDLNTKRVHWHFSTQTQIGRSAISPDEKLIAICNLAGGFDLYDLHSHEKTKTYLVPTPKDGNVPLPVSFIHEGEDLLFGSSCGAVQITDVVSPIVQKLPHPDSDIIQAIAYYRMGDVYYIVTGSSETETRTYVKIWRASSVSAHSARITQHPDAADRSMLHAVAATHAEAVKHDIDPVQDVLRSPLSACSIQLAVDRGQEETSSTLNGDQPRPGLCLGNAGRTSDREVGGDQPPICLVDAGITPDSELSGGGEKSSPYIEGAEKTRRSSLHMQPDSSPDHTLTKQRRLLAFLVAIAVIGGFVVRILTASVASNALSAPKRTYRVSRDLVVFSRWLRNWLIIIGHWLRNWLIILCRRTLQWFPWLRELLIAIVGFPAIE
ncbi:hypothetical protein NM688_g3877 [Phlebia brevispora]|uniref:Uncharacterized protein n=1 Tax=Phlebia brevispora TaxID=194682 RepID=A0ACC1T4P9_9APHY|nr:hypothetical protein NM688_g3877 [Phlebia brevispora]